MKKQFILGSLIAITNFSYSQSTIVGNSLSGSLPSSPTQFIGSSNAADLIFKAGNVEFMRILSTGIHPSPNVAGSIGIGNVLPVNKLDIVVTRPDDGIRVQQINNGSAALILTNTTTGGKSWSLNSLGINNNHGAGNFSIYEGSNSRLFIKGADGNVGIGITAPVAKLDVNGDIKLAAASLGSSAIEMAVTGNPVGTTKYKVFGNGSTYIGNFSGVTYNANASVLTLGQATATDKAISIINGTNPTAADVFAVYGNGKTIISSPGLAELRVTTPTTNASKVWVCNSLSSYNFGIDNAAVGHIGCNINSPTPVNIMNFGLYGNAQPQAWIGNLKPTTAHNDFMFAIDGKLVAREIIVTIQGWADYVFDRNYKLQSLENVEKYIKENNHLPNIPSAKEIESNGISLSEISKLQMAKIEELTLYIIELKKDLEVLKEKINNNK